MILTPSLLITDDDRDFRETLRDVFESRGFATILAADGEEALTIVRSQTVHIILLDMHMPRLTGLETIRQLRQFPRPLPTILMSAALDQQIEQQARDEQVFSILAKPVSFATLRDVVRDAMMRTYSWAG